MEDGRMLAAIKVPVRPRDGVITPSAMTSRLIKSAVHRLLWIVFLVCSTPVCRQSTHHRTGSGEPPVMESIVVTAERIDAFIEGNPHQVSGSGMDEIRARNMCSVVLAAIWIPSRSETT
jgi:hypothetical protein